MPYELPAEVVSALPDEVKTLVTKPEVLAVFEKVVTPLVTAKGTLLNEKKTLQADIDALGGLEKVKASLTEYTTLKGQTEEERNKAIKASADVEAVRSDLAGKLQTAQQSADAWRNKFADRSLNNLVMTAVSAAEGDPELLMPFLKSRIKSTMDEAGNVKVDVLKADGTPMLNANGDAAGLTDLVNEYKNSERFGVMFKASNKGGSGAGNGNGAPGLANNPFKKGATFNVTEQMKLYKSNPTLAKSLALAEGIKLD